MWVSWITSSSSSCRLQSNLDEATDNWGIKVERVEIKDVKLPHQLQRAMAAEAEAAREARAKVGTCNTNNNLLHCIIKHGEAITSLC